MIFYSIYLSLLFSKDKIYKTNNNFLVVKCNIVVLPLGTQNKPIMSCRVHQGRHLFETRRFHSTKKSKTLMEKGRQIYVAKGRNPTLDMRYFKETQSTLLHR